MSVLGIAASPAAERPRAGPRAAAAGALAERAWLRDPLVLALCGAVAFLCWAGLAARYIWLRPTPDSPIGHLPNALGSAAGEVAIWIALTAAAFEVAWRFP
ncbi:MAG TPA: hypothetical protein VFR81_01990, partial [Longimicrobium sp.]|nr:hypothetical protein [Longimicrobium sp.]